MPNKTLLKAAEYIQKHGWIQGAYRENEIAKYPRVCAIGAIYKVTGMWTSKPRYTEAEAADMCLSRYLQNQHVALWNDGTERTKEEVINTLLKAAESC